MESEIKALALAILFARFYDGDDQKAMDKSFTVMKKINDRIFKQTVKNTLRG